MTGLVIGLAVAAGIGRYVAITVIGLRALSGTTPRQRAGIIRALAALHSPRRQDGRNGPAE